MGLIEIIIGAVALIAGLAIGRPWGRMLGHRKAREQERQLARERDHERADDIRRRARNADGMHDQFVDRGYRD